MSKNKTVFFQLFEPVTSTYTYLIADEKTKEAAIIDPVYETVERDLKLISELGLKLKYIIDTHVHADHITAAGTLREKTGAKTVVGAASRVECSDILIKDNDLLSLGDKKIKALSTPGHTDACMSFLFEDMVFTGDSLMIRGTGRTDFQQGSPEKQYDSIHSKLYVLPDDTKVYPGHDYRGQTCSTIGLEKQFNPRVGLSKSKEQHKSIMNELKLEYPKKIDASVPANLKCGILKKETELIPMMNDGIREVSVEQVKEVLNKVKLIDVRRPDEFIGELGHIPGSILITMGPELENYLETGDRNEEIVFVCRSGARSGNVTAVSQQLGYKHTVNMMGGMIRWNELGLTVER